MPSTPPPLLPSHSSQDVRTSSSPLSSPRKTTWAMPLTPRRGSGSPAEERNGLFGEKEFSDAKNSIDLTPNLPEEPKKKKGLGAKTIIPIWIALSSAVILYNMPEPWWAWTIKWLGNTLKAGDDTGSSRDREYLYTNLNFPYPIFITSYHLGCAALGTRILRATTHLLDGLDSINMTRDLYTKSILPIGVLFSGSLILSNTAYLTLSVSFIQMLKAFTPVAILLISAIFRIQSLNQRLVLIVILISTGCALAAYGEVHFELFGFLCQSSAVVFESSRLVMIQILLQGLKMDPLVSLHYYAPVCAVINACFLPFTEGLAPFRELARIGPLVLLSNAGVAFGLNVAAVFLIGAAGGLVLTLAGVFKDILLITSSCLFFGSRITPIQIFGYSLALGGLMAYKNASGKK